MNDIKSFLTIDKFKKLYPKCKDPDTWVELMLEMFPAYDINSLKRIAAFVAQAGHESVGWTVFSENLNYSAEGLRKIFPSHFTTEQAKTYARRPEKIANRAYANRMGNGSEASGDGWRYRGCGPFQLTGHDNYRAFSVDTLDGNEVDCQALLEDKKLMLLSALWFWKSRKLNNMADFDAITAMTMRINGGTIGLKERIQEYNRVTKVLKE